MKAAAPAPPRVRNTAPVTAHLSPACADPAAASGAPQLPEPARDAHVTALRCPLLAPGQVTPNRRRGTGLTLCPDAWATQVLVMSASRAAADTLFARFLGPRFSHLDIGTLHLAGGLEGASPAAQFAREAGVTELPSLVAWPDGLDSSQPAILSVGSSSGTEQREELLQSLQKLAVPSMPELTAANYFERCQPAADRPAGGLCVLLLVPALATWSESTTHAYGTMRRLAIQGAVEGVQFAWLDSARHTGFADSLRSRDPAFRGEAAPADQPMVVALRAASARTGLRKVQAAQMFSGVGQLSEAQLSEWVADLRAETARAWGAARELPPLGGPVPPRVTSWLWAWMARGGWLIVSLVLGAVAVLIVYSEAIIKWAEKLRAQQPAGGGGRKPAPQESEQPRQPHVEPPAHKRREQPGHAAGRDAARDADSEPSPASSSGGDSGADGHTSNGLPPGVVALTEHTIAEVLGGSANVLLFAVNAGKVDRASMDGLMRHFGARGRDGSDALRGWTLAVLDVSAALRVERKSPLLRSVLGRLLTSPCAVVRHARKLSTYSGVATPGRVEEWLDRLTMGELAWENLAAES